MQREHHETRAIYIAGAALVALTAAAVTVVPRSPSWWTLALLAVTVGAAAAAVAVAEGGGRWLVPAAPHVAAASPDRPKGDVSPHLLIATLALALLTGTAAARSGDTGVTHGDVARLWLATVLVFLLATWWGPLLSCVGLLRSGSGVPDRFTWRAALPWIGVAAIATLPRVLMLDRYPTVLSGDEGTFMMIGRQVWLGDPPNPFGPGFMGNPNLYPVLQGWVAGGPGAAPADYRLVSGVVGALGVLATWRLARYLTSPEAAIAAAVVLASMPFHLHFSRLGLNNVTDPTILTASLWLTLRSAVSGRSGDAALTGVVLGFGFYGYFGGRAIPVVVLLALAILVAGHRAQPLEGLRIAAWTVAGFGLTALPLLQAYRETPSALWGRLDDVSPLSIDALRTDPASTIELFLANLRDALVYPIASAEHGFYRQDAPLVGWAVALLLLAGSATIPVRVIRDRQVPAVAVLVPAVVVVASGVALTVPIQSQRLLALTPIWAIVAGTGLALVARWAGLGHRSLMTPIAHSVLAVALVVLVVTDLRWFASEDRQGDTYADATSTAMWDIGWRVANANGGEPPRILLAGPPFVFTGGFNSLVIQAPELEMADIAEPLGTAPAPALGDDVLLVIPFHRAGERCEAERLYPEATFAEARARDGTLLYIALYREPPEGWSFETSPAETVFVPLAPADACQQDDRR